MAKYSAKKEIEKLIKDYELHRNEYKQKGYDEHQFCIRLLNRFFNALGWDVENNQSKSEFYCDTIFQYKLKNEKTTKFPDYAFGFPAKTSPKFFAEAKTPATIIHTDKDPALQIRRYGKSGGLAISVVTNFEEFAIYDCTTKAKETDSSRVGRLEYFTYKEYPEKFDLLWELFSKEGIEQGYHDKYIKTDTKKKGSATLDKEFVATLDGWRKYLATSISHNNMKLTNDEINFTVQQTIDRIIFLRFCEDRSIEKFETLLSVTKKGDYYKNLYQLFTEADIKYNSGLFDFEKDNISHKIKVDNKIIRNVIEELYRPKSDYEFGVMPVEILGNAYEEFLGKVIRVTPGHIVKIDIAKKPEVQKAGGVFYTPQYIVNYIVEHTVGKLIEGKSPEQISKIKIVDPACGSGSFLLRAYIELLRYHTDYYWKMNFHKKREKNYLITHEGRLSVTEKKRILQNNLFGVDIDSNAVEVTKLSLLLKAMEGETGASIGQQLRLDKKGILPDLDNNIQCGNSLISPDFYYEQLNFDTGEKKKINAFDWKAGFPLVFRQGGFDAVIGNPPWISLSGKFGNDILNEDAQQHLISKYNGNTYMPNLYEYFIHKGLSLTKKDGYFSFIVPDRFGFNNQFVNLRKKILEQYKIEELQYKAKFPNITTDTLIFRIVNPTHKRKNYAIAVGEFAKEKQIKQSSEYLLDHEYKFTYEKSDDIGKLLDKIFNHKKTEPLITLIDTTSGFGGKSDAITESRKNKRQIKIFRGRSVQKFYLGEIFYFEFIKSNITGRTTDTKKLGAKEKVLIRKTGTANSLFATYDNSKIFPEQSLYFLFNNKTQTSLKYFTGLLNSNLFKFVYWNNLVTNRDSTPQLKKNDLDRFPVYHINFKTHPSEKSKHDSIIRQVDNLLQLNKDLKKAKLPNDKNNIVNRISSAESKLNEIIYELYGISNKEIELVENNIQ